MTPIRIATLLFLLFSCSKPSGDRPSKLVEIKNYTFDDVLTGVMKADLIITETEDSIFYSYMSNDTVVFPFVTAAIGKNSDSELRLHNDRTPIVAKKTFRLGEVDVEIAKYDFDAPDEIDEEAYVYFVKGYGLLALRGRGWFYIIHFDDGSQLGKEAMDILDSDTTGFFVRPRHL